MNGAEEEMCVRARVRDRLGFRLFFNYQATEASISVQLKWIHCGEGRIGKVPMGF